MTDPIAYKAEIQHEDGTIITVVYLATDSLPAANILQTVPLGSHEELQLFKRKNSNRKKELRRLNKSLEDISRGVLLNVHKETIARQNRQISALNEELRLLRSRL